MGGAERVKIYKQTSVYEESISRIERLFDEFDNIVVSVSGGKDSTVCMELTLEVARRRNRLPLKVLFVDQEAEWQHTVDYIREVMYRPEVEPLWMQIPIRLYNCTSYDQNWLYCWDANEKDKWVHEQGPISLKENIYGTDRFHPIFAKICSNLFHGEPYADIAGVRANESLGRFGAVTADRTYKDIAWGKKEKHGYTFYPIYDWTVDDIWTYIAMKKCSYNRIYDLMFNYGIPTGRMRVSNLHHETAYHELFFLQEVEHDTYNRLVNRLPGIATFNQMQEAGIFPRELPDMFGSWCEYRDYLLETLVKPELRPYFRRNFHNQSGEEWGKEHVYEILVNDYEGTKNHNMAIAKAQIAKIGGGAFDRKYGNGNHKSDQSCAGSEH